MMKKVLIVCCVILAAVALYVNFSEEYDQESDPALLIWGLEPVAGIVSPAEEHKVGSEALLDLGGGVKLALCWVPDGEFVMGSEKGEKTEVPLHKVAVKGFWMGKHEVTQKEYLHVMGNNPSYFRKDGENLPAESVSWYDAKQFCRKASKLSGAMVRLPTTAEWEHACRAGNRTVFSVGDTEEDLARIAWYRENALTNTHVVGMLAPNDFGLYDIIGNVWEWCEDVWHDSYEGAPDDGSAWITNGSSKQRCLRGASWLNVPSVSRIAYRYKMFPSYEGPFYGMRVAVSP